MRTLLFALIFGTSIAHADTAASIPLADVASAFSWIKIAPEFPIVLTSDGDDQISFRILDDVYTITNEKQSFKIVKMSYLRGIKVSEEVISLDAMTVEKILKFVQAKSRAAGVLSDDAFQGSIKNDAPTAGFQASKTLFQCKSDLPSRITQNGSVVNEIFQHTWLQNGPRESFGMPNTDEATYFGGRAHIRTPDSFVGKGPKHLECSPVLIPMGLDEQKVSKKALCVARSLSLSQNPIFESSTSTQTWVANFDYHALERNCLVAVRFMLECAGATAPQVVNAGIGGKLDWKDVYSVSDYPAELKQQMVSLRAQLEQVRVQGRFMDLPAQAEQMMNAAIDLDSKVRGVTATPNSKNLREICDLALANCP